MCNKALLENGGTSESLSHFYKNQKMVVNTYYSKIQFVPDCYKFQVNVW